MSATALPFTRDEYAARLAKTRTAMDKAGIDLLFVEDPSNMAWLTGYDGWSFYVHQGVLVFPDGTRCGGAAPQDLNGAVAHLLDGRRPPDLLPRQLRAVGRAPPDAAARRDHPRPRLRQRSASGWSSTTTTSPPRPT